MSKLHDAAQAGNVPVVEHLLADGVSVDEGDEEDWTALMWGAPFFTVTEMLLEAGADPNHSTPEGESVLMAFARRAPPRRFACCSPLVLASTTPTPPATTH